MIAIQNQLVGAAIGQTIALECQSEAYPKSINYWMKNREIIIPGLYKSIDGLLCITYTSDNCTSAVGS